MVRPRPFTVASRILEAVMSEESVGYQFVDCPNCTKSTPHKVYGARFGQTHEAECIDCGTRHGL